MMLDDYLRQCGGVSYKALEKYADDPLPPLTVPLSLLSSKSASPSGPAVAANAGGVRVEWYLGPDMSIKAEALDKFEATGQYVIEPKHDGMWAMLLVQDPKNGKPHLLKSRDAKTGYVGGGNAGDLVLTELPFEPGTVLVGELEAATEASMKFFQTFHHRRLHLFDFPKGGYDHRALPWTARRALLEGAHHALTEHAKTRFPLVEAFTDKFRQRYEAWVEAGGEGCVIKRKDSTYTTARSDGKSDFWHRCKKTCTEDYVLCGIGKTAGGVPAGLWGLMINGKLKKVMQKGCPEHLLVPANIGKLVCEFMGWERFDSGALRHAQFVRTRSDKAPEECIHNGGEV